MDKSAAQREDLSTAQAGEVSSFRLTEQVLESFSKAVQIEPFNDSLFDLASGGDLAGRIGDFLSAILAADVDEMLHHQSYGHSILGGDLEARIKFALSRKSARAAMERAESAARSTSERVQLLETSLFRLRADYKRLSAVAIKAKDIAEATKTPLTSKDADLKDRFERRRANLGALQAANALTLAQIPLAVAHHRKLLERFVEAKTLLFPAWERHALSVVESPRDSVALGAFRAAVIALTTRLTERVDSAA